MAQKGFKKWGDALTRVYQQQSKRKPQVDEAIADVFSNPKSINNEYFQELFTHHFKDYSCWHDVEFTHDSPHLFLPKEAPRYPSAIWGLLGTYIALIVLQTVYTSWCWIENKRRDKQGFHGEMEEELLQGFDDMTDKQNKHFRYHL